MRFIRIAPLLSVLCGCASAARPEQVPAVDSGPPAAIDAAVPMYPQCGPSRGPGGSWSPLPAEGAPAGSAWPTSVWTGTEMIVWGGQGMTEPTGGGVYDPRTSRWRSISMQGSVQSSIGIHPAAWTGTEMFVWNTLTRVGGLYDPASDRWRTVASEGAPISRGIFAAVWTGSLIIAWGGLADGDHNECALYDPSRDRWQPCISPREQSARLGSSVVWTGDEMISWGGYDVSSGFNTAPTRNDGWRYNPVANAWASVSLDAAPSRRNVHVGLWTGSEMIIWGGHRNTAPSFSDGARYHPASDTWTPMSIAGAPSGPTSSYPKYRGVWTGREMIVWSGEPGSWIAGGRYDPETDHWAPLATEGMPAARNDFAVEWTGCELLVWGGATVRDPNGRYHRNGAAWHP